MKTTNNYIRDFYTGQYARWNIPSGWSYTRWTDCRDLNPSALTWVASPENATDFGGQVEDVISFLHAFTPHIVYREARTVALNS